MKMSYRIAAALSALALVFALNAATPTHAEAGQRVIGFGFNLAAGATGAGAWYEGDSIVALAPIIELASLELQLCPIDHFSIDLQWNWLPMVLVAASGTPFYMQATYFHFHFTPNIPISLALAPMIRFAVGNTGYGNQAIVWPGLRLGLELNSPKKKFAWGIYARPAAAFANVAGVSMVSVEAVIELTWTFYAVKDSGGGGGSKDSSAPPKN